MITNLRRKLSHYPLLKKVIKIFIAAFFISIASRFFIIYAGIYSAGVSGLSQGITYTIYDLLANDSGILWGLDAVAFKNTFYWFVYAGINVPIVIWAWSKFGKKFIGLSVMAFGFAFMFSMMWANIPGLKDLEFIPGFDASVADDAVVYSVAIISALIGAVVGGIGLGVVFNQGASTLGTDPLTRYVSREKGMSPAAFMFTISIVNITIWNTVGWAVGGELNGATFIQDVFFSYKMLASIIYMAVYSLIAATIHPVSRKYIVKVTSDKATQIVDYLNDQVHFHRGQTIYNSVGGYTKAKKKTIEMVINSEEYHDLLHYVKKIDDRAFVVAIKAEKIRTASNVSWTPKTKEEIELKKQKEKTQELALKRRATKKPIRKTAVKKAVQSKKTNTKKK